jgi:hypothetical protein
LENAEKWTGTYFKSIPISLTAVPKPGFRFVGWSGTDLSFPHIELELEEDIILTAIFVPKDEKGKM